LELEQEADLCLGAGINFISFPILDRDVPPSFESTAALARFLSDKIDGGHAIAIHCRAGIGRSALVAASALVCLGFTSTEAFDKLSKARGVKVPDTDGQREWGAAFEKMISHPKDA
jgi:protein-tyrosine phosphatase